MENKKTAVEWLISQLNIWQSITDEDTNQTLDTVRKLLEQAKEIELAQRIDDYNNGHIDRNNNRFKLPKLNQNETND
jgi:hypothetical protein